MNPRGPRPDGAAEQLGLFANEEPRAEAQGLPPGFRFHPGLISTEAEAELLRNIRVLPFREFQFHGYVGKRRTVSFGWSYDFEREALAAAEPLPAFLLPLRREAAAFAGLAPDAFVQALVTEYGPGAEIGWHRDKGVFGIVVGVSLLSACRFRLRRRTGETWERVTIEALARSAYLLSGPSRQDWEHSFPPFPNSATPSPSAVCAKRTATNQRPSE